MAARIIANLIIAGGGVVIRAAAQAYRQALVNAQRSGVSAENASAAFKSQLSVQEAQQILGVEKNATLEQVRKKFQHLFKVNEEHGSFYLQSKVYRAKERLDQEFKATGIDVDAFEAEQAANQAAEHAEQAGSKGQQ